MFPASDSALVGSARLLGFVFVAANLKPERIHINTHTQSVSSLLILSGHCLNRARLKLIQHPGFEGLISQSLDDTQRQGAARLTGVDALLSDARGLLTEEAHLIRADCSSG